MGKNGEEKRELVGNGSAGPSSGITSADVRPLVASLKEQEEQLSAKIRGLTERFVQECVIFDGTKNDDGAVVGAINIFVNSCSQDLEDIETLIDEFKGLFVAVLRKGADLYPLDDILKKMESIQGAIFSAVKGDGGLAKTAERRRVKFDTLGQLYGSEEEFRQNFVKLEQGYNKIKKMTSSGAVAIDSEKLSKILQDKLNFSVTQEEAKAIKHIYYVNRIGKFSPVMQSFFKPREIQGKRVRGGLVKLLTGCCATGTESLIEQLEREFDNFTQLVLQQRTGKVAVHQQENINRAIDRVLGVLRQFKDVDPARDVIGDEAHTLAREAALKAYQSVLTCWGDADVVGKLIGETQSKRPYSPVVVQGLIYDMSKAEKISDLEALIGRLKNVCKWLDQTDEYSTFLSGNCTRYEGDRDLLRKYAEIQGNEKPKQLVDDFLEHLGHCVRQNDGVKTALQFERRTQIDWLLGAVEAYKQKMCEFVQVLQSGKGVERKLLSDLSGRVSNLLNQIEQSKQQVADYCAKLPEKGHVFGELMQQEMRANRGELEITGKNGGVEGQDEVKNPLNIVRLFETVCGELRQQTEILTDPFMDKFTHVATNKEFVESAGKFTSKVDTSTDVLAKESTEFLLNANEELKIQCPDKKLS